MTYYDNPLDELKGKTVDAYEMAVKIYEMSKKLKNEDTINGLGYATALLFEMATKALEQEPCDDCVSRQAVLNYISRLLNQGTGKKKSFEFIQRYVKKLPPVNPQRIGHWIEVHPLQEDDGGAYMCSECRCGHPYIAPHWKYCPNCGARTSESKYFAELSKSFAQGLRQGLQESEDRE